MGIGSRGHGLQRGTYDLAKLSISDLDEEMWQRRKDFTRHPPKMHATFTEICLFGPGITRRFYWYVLEKMVMPTRLSLIGGGRRRTTFRMGRTDREGLACAWQRLNGRSVEYPPLGSSGYGDGLAAAPRS